MKYALAHYAAIQYRNQNLDELNANIRWCSIKSFFCWCSIAKINFLAQILKSPQSYIESESAIYKYSVRKVSGKGPDFLTDHFTWDSSRVEWGRGLI